ncbi:formylglycine-generating enzyme family protein [uncultured Thiodictyon sp.]|jgi:formylglycine-generating enzyme required for sulfatase activity|uniref:formylglycine-generating enzyme family protein n=1 Tax=uncultured Thiodictyon sp. TaxID=1846217 RepID=UPI0025FA75EF|nr:formylglycine-generating enzyme family protein [uncultured Thiodictyon sp.]
MEPSVRDTLRQLIARYGHSLCDDPRRCEAMLRDLCGQHKREVFILVSALRQRVAADLLGGSGALPTPLLLGRLRKRLEDELALTGEAAHWAVETWALALGIIAGPVIFPTPTPTPAAAPPPPPKPAKEPQPPPKPTFRDRLKDGSEGPEMVRLPPGRFLMGAPAEDDLADAKERPQHEVRIARPFAIGRFPVTFEDYDRFVAATNRQPPDDEGWGRGRRPVINVSWRDAVVYCVWLSAKTGRTYRLPSEAEWEYAGRAGTATRWSYGDDEKTLGDYAWFCDNSGGRTHPVGEKRPNPWGLHDIDGNVLEWVQDVWHKDYAGAPTDGSAWGAPSNASSSSNPAGRGVRGGSCGGNAGGNRVSSRGWHGPADRDGFLGLRLAQDL